MTHHANITIPHKHFYMIRHGETEANAAQVMAGSLDSPLTNNGIQQAKIARDVVAQLKVKPKIVIHSQLSRARNTARIINESLNAPMHEDPRYAEMHAGDWEGAPYKACEKLFKTWIDAPNGETVQAFFDRVRCAKTDALQRHEAPVLAVCHGGVFRAFWQLYNIHSEGVKNCVLYEFTPKTERCGFPWDVFYYDYEDSHNVTRRPAHMSNGY